MAKRSKTKHGHIQNLLLRHTQEKYNVRDPRFKVVVRPGLAPEPGRTMNVEEPLMEQGTD